MLYVLHVTVPLAHIIPGLWRVHREPGNLFFLLLQQAHGKDVICSHTKPRAVPCTQCVLSDTHAGSTDLVTSPPPPPLRQSLGAS